MLRAESSSMQEAVALIEAAKRPIILAGHGIVDSGARDQVIDFAERRQIPVASTLLGLGAFPTDHPLSLGMMGMHGETWVNHAIQQSDLLLAFGMRFDDRVTGNLAQYAPNAKKIHIEIDPSEINKNVRADVALIGDLKEVLDTLLPARPAKKVRRQLDRRGQPDEGRRQRARHHQPAQQRPPLRRACHPRHLARGPRLRSPRTDHHRHRRRPAPDVGSPYFRHDTMRSLITSGGLGTMGFALPAAIGAKFACPEKDVWVIAGDGGFQMTASELATILQEKIDLNIAVINNGFLGMVRQWQEIFYEKNYECTPIVSPDFVALAAAHGIAGAAVASAPSHPHRHPRPTSGKAFLIEFKVEKEDGVYPMIAPGSALHEMVLRPAANPLIELPEDA